MVLTCSPCQNHFHRERKGGLLFTWGPLLTVTVGSIGESHCLKAAGTLHLLGTALFSTVCLRAVSVQIDIRHNKTMLAEWNIVIGV